jgi:hypothetical protein
MNSIIENVKRIKKIDKKKLSDIVKYQVENSDQLATFKKIKKILFINKKEIEGEITPKNLLEFIMENKVQFHFEFVDKRLRKSSTDEYFLGLIFYVVRYFDFPTEDFLELIKALDSEDIHYGEVADVVKKGLITFSKLNEKKISDDSFKLLLELM